MTCVCCGNELPCENSQVCKYCLDDARNDKREMINGYSRRSETQKQTFEKTNIWKRDSY